MEFDWNGICYFVTLVEKQTLTATAESLGVQHTTVARQITNLEKNLNLTLFHREGKKFILSEEGRALFEYAQPLCQNMKSLLEISNKLSNKQD